MNTNPENKDSRSLNFNMGGNSPPANLRYNGSPLAAFKMGETVVDLPENYKQTQAINNALGQIENLDFEQQISVLRDVANTMGFSEVKPIPTQAEVGKTASL